MKRDRIECIRTAKSWNIDIDNIDELLNYVKSSQKKIENFLQ